MEGVLKSDIFFFVTTVAVALVTTGIIIALIYLIRIMRNAESLSRTIRHEGEETAEGIGAFFRNLFKRKNIKNEERDK